MEAPERSNVGTKHSYVQMPASRTGSRRRNLLGETALVFLLTLVLAVAIDMAWRVRPSSNKLYIGSIELKLTQLGLRDQNLIFGPTSYVETFIPRIRAATSPVDSIATARLGDVRVRRLKSGTRSDTNSPPEYVFLASVFDPRIEIGEPPRAGGVAPSAPTKLQADVRNNFNAEAAEEPKKPVDNSKLNQPALRQPTKELLKNPPPETKKDIGQDAAKDLVRQDTKSPGTDVKKKETRAPDDLITSAVMCALLRAETLGISTVGINARITDDETAPLPAIIEGIRRVEPHLTRVNQVLLDIKGEMPGVIHRESALSSRLVRTPLAWPGGEAFYKPREMDMAGLPADTSGVFNGAFKLGSRTTGWPAVVLLLGLFGAFSLRLRSIPRDRLKRDRYGILIGTACALLAVVVLYALRFMWHVGPDYIFGSLPVLMTTALVGGIAIGASAGWARASTVSVEPEPIDDNALRSILHPDKPIESVEEDRLGFRPVVGALRRFLDNPATIPPVVLSINGPWGSGKSSVMKMLRTELRKTRRFSTVWFNAWRFHKEEQILAAFLKTIASDLRRDGLSARLAWVRLRHYSIWQYLLLLSPVVLVTIASFRESAAEVLQAILGFITAGSETPDETKVNTLVQVLGIGGPLLWLVRMAIPFQLQFRRLYETKDQSKRIGFLDEFAREFDLYREAVGDRKFVIFIDDLDRCPPDKIVDVLKTINLITTSGNAASTTFFVLGYDPKYITRSIELHFKEFTRRGTAIDAHFGAEYLKKMVTLSVSVPTPTPEERTQLAKRLGDAEEKEEEAQRSWRDRAVLRARLVPKWTLRMAIAVSIAALAVVLAMHVHSGQSGSTSSWSDSGSIRDGTQNRAEFVFSLSAVRAPADDVMPWWVWTIPLIVVFGSTVVLFIRSRPTAAEVMYIRQPKDTEEFVNAVEACKDLLPENPRDVVRALNLMRMQYLVQDIDVLKPASSANADATDSGALTEWECVSYNVLQLRHPRFFSYDFFHTRLMPALSSAGPGMVSEFYRTRLESLELPATLVSDIACLEKTTRGIHHMADTKKLDRYLEANRYVLDSAPELIDMHDSEGFSESRGHRA